MQEHTEQGNEKLLHCLLSRWVFLAELAVAVLCCLPKILKLIPYILIVDVVKFFTIFNHLTYSKYFKKNHIFYYDLFYY
jgi:hypothetical protein